MNPIGYVQSPNLYNAALLANGLTDPSGRRFIVNTVYKTIAQIRRSSKEPLGFAYTKQISLTWQGVDRVWVEKVSPCCFCAHVSEQQKEEPILVVDIWLPHREDALILMTDRGFSDLIDHEMRRYEVFRRAYDEFLVGHRTACNPVCRKNREEARGALSR
jgi:hypothetical protein